jgi:HSP20 family protein
MKFTLLSALALATAPSTVQSWSIGPLFYPSDALVVRTTFPSMLARQQALADQVLQQTDQMFQQGAKLSLSSSPRYDLVDDETKFQLSVDVPGIKMKDIDISLEDGYLTVRGQRVSKDDHSKFMSKFSKTFSVDPAVDVDKFSATLDHGVLMVTAPKNMKKLEENVRKIPIMAGSSSVVAEAPSSLPATTSEEEDTIDLDKKVDEKNKIDVKETVEVKKKHDDEDVKEKELMGGEF